MNEVKFYDFGDEGSQEYKEVCECGKEHMVSTQQDHDPEYYTEVHIKCDCGLSVKFKLPVN